MRLFCSPFEVNRFNRTLYTDCNLTLINTKFIYGKANVFFFTLSKAGQSQITVLEKRAKCWFCHLWQYHFSSFSFLKKKKWYKFQGVKSRDLILLYRKKYVDQRSATVVIKNTVQIKISSSKKSKKEKET